MGETRSVETNKFNFPIYLFCFYSSIARFGLQLQNSLRYIRHKHEKESCIDFSSLFSSLKKALFPRSLSKPKTQSKLKIDSTKQNENLFIIFLNMNTQKASKLPFLVSLFCFDHFSAPKIPLLRKNTLRKVILNSQNMNEKNNDRDIKSGMKALVQVKHIRLDNRKKFTQCCSENNKLLSPSNFSVGMRKKPLFNYSFHTIKIDKYGNGLRYGHLCLPVEQFSIEILKWIRERLEQLWSLIGEKVLNSEILLLLIAEAILNFMNENILK